MHTRRTSVSYTSLLMLGFIGGGGLLTYLEPQIGALPFALGVVLAAANSRHYLILSGPAGLFTSGGPEICLFAGANSEIFGGSPEWTEETLLGGFQLGLGPGPVGNHKPDLQLGLEKTFQDRKNDHYVQRLQPFVSARYCF